MSAKTSIEWTRNPDGTKGKSWNPGRGCKEKSPGCLNCYAKRIAARFSDTGMAFDGYAKRGPHGGRWTGKVSLLEDALDAPLHWRKPQTVFVNSMTDMFHPGYSYTQIAAVFGVMAACPQHTFIVLTKHPERAVEWFRWVQHREAPFAAPASHRTDREVNGRVGAHLRPTVVCREAARTYTRRADRFDLPWPLPNVRIGVSIESQEYADERVPLLLQIPAAVRLLSCEPQLGPVDLDPPTCPTCGEHDWVPSDDPDHGGLFCREHGDEMAFSSWFGPELIDWVIAGGESGPGARPFDLQWGRSLAKQCAEAGVPFFFKQAGSRSFDSAQPPDGEFRTFERWVDHAKSWIGGTGAACVDAKGRLCEIGTDFMRARDEGAFPVSYWIPLELKNRKGGDLAELPADLRVRQSPGEVRP